MTAFRSPKGFEDRWRSLLEPRRYADGRIMMTPQLRSTLRAITARAPQAVIKKSSGPKSQGALVRHLNYISRNGELALEGRDRETVCGRPALLETAQDWAADDIMRSRVPEIAKSYVLSYRDSSDRESVHTAGRAFAHEIFSHNHEYLLVPHADTPHPHLHVVVRALGDNGQRLVPGPGEFEDWRRRWGEALARAGLDAAVSPRWVRGSVQRYGQTIALAKMEQGWRNGVCEAPRVLRSAHQRALSVVRGEAQVDEPWAPAIERRHQLLMRTYDDAADELFRSNKPDDLQLARAVADLRRSSSNETRHVMLLRHARQYECRRMMQEVERELEEKRRVSRDQEPERGRDRERGPSLSR